MAKRASKKLYIVEWTSKAAIPSIISLTLSLVITLKTNILFHLFSDDPDKKFWVEIFGWFVFLQCYLNWYCFAQLGPSKVTKAMEFTSALTDISIDPVEGATVSSHQTSQRAAMSFNKANNNELISRQNGEKSSLMGELYNLPSDWEYCSLCEMFTPPRSHHCSICSCCVLKHDHHCVFARCIGFRNQRRFIVFSTYSTLASCYAIVNIYLYLEKVTQTSLLSWHGYQYFPTTAIISWIIGSISAYDFLLIMLLNITFLVFILSVFYLIWQWVLVIRGQTSYEYMTKNHKYERSLLTNIASVWGPIYLIPFHYILPLPVSQTGDGIDWSKDKLH